MKQQIETPERRVLAPIFGVPVPARPLQFHVEPATPVAGHFQPAIFSARQTLFHA